MEYNLDELQWKCLTCEVTAPPTNSDYMNLIKHAKGHVVRLVHTGTGEVLATSPKGAFGKDILIPGYNPKGGQKAGGQKAGGQKAGGQKSSGQQQGGEMVAITQPKPGAIIFSVGLHEIPLEPQYLYESYLYYTDLKARIDLEESFSEALKDAMTYVWRRLCPHEANEKELAVKEG